MDTSNWKWFKIEDESLPIRKRLFHIKKGKRLTKEDMIPGDIPFIGATDSNNGVTAHISNNRYLHPANTITVSYNGSISEAFFQEHEFWASDDINVLYPQFPITKEIAIFFITIINREKYRFNYGRKWEKEKMKSFEILLPVTENGSPDFQFMNDFISSLTNSLTPLTISKWKGEDVSQGLLNSFPLSDTASWKWFNYSDIFIILKGFYNKKPDDVKGSEFPFIGATDSNNGITSFSDFETIENSSKTGDENNSPIEEKIYPGGCITISNNGSVGYAFYQPKDFICSHDVNPIFLKGVRCATCRDTENCRLCNNKVRINPYIGMFLCTVIELERFRWDYGRKWRPKRMPSSKIKLPVDSNGNPDWEYMGNFIKSLPYSSNL